MRYKIVAKSFFVLFFVFMLSGDSDVMSEQKYDEKYQIKYSELIGEVGHIYDIEIAELWNPWKEEYNAVEWYKKEGGTYAVVWPVDIIDPRPNKDYAIVFNAELSKWSENYSVVVSDSDGNVIFSEELGGDGGAKVYEVYVCFPEEGRFTIRLMQTWTGIVIGRVAGIIYVIPTKEPRLV